MADDEHIAMTIGGEDCEEHGTHGGIVLGSEGNLYSSQFFAEGQAIPPTARVPVRHEDGRVYLEKLCGSSGPVMVNSRAFKSGWERTFGREAN